MGMSLIEFRQLYREYRDQTCDLLQASVENQLADDVTESRLPLTADQRALLAQFPLTLERDAGREILFARLLRQYRKDTKKSRRDVRREMEDGSFWERFFEWLSNVDWEKLFDLILKFIEGLLRILSLL